MGLVSKDDGWRLSDELWARMQPLLPERPPHPLGCHNPRVPDRAAMDAILLVLRTGMQWNALSATGICSCSSAYRRFREWVDASVFEAFWRAGLLEYDRLRSIDWSKAGAGLCDDQGTAGRGKKPAPTPPTAPKAAQSAACSLRQPASRWPSRSTGPTATTPSSWKSR